jgi:hypothetical protein
MRRITNLIPKQAKLHAYDVTSRCARGKSREGNQHSYDVLRKSGAGLVHHLIRDLD